MYILNLSSYSTVLSTVLTVDSFKIRTENIKEVEKEIEEIQKHRVEFAAAANRLSVLIEQTGRLIYLNPLYEFGTKNFTF